MGPALVRDDQAEERCLHAFPRRGPGTDGSPSGPLRGRPARAGSVLWHLLAVFELYAGHLHRLAVDRRQVSGQAERRRGLTAAFVNDLVISVDSLTRDAASASNPLWSASAGPHVTAPGGGAR